MNLQASIFTSVIVVFILITIAFSIRYAKLLIIAEKEYEKAKNVVAGIVFTFKKNQDRQNETIEQLTLQTEARHSAIERLTNNFQGIEVKLKNFISKMESAPEMYNTAIEQTNSIKKEISLISENQQNQQKQLSLLEEKIITIEKTESNLGTVNENQTPNFLKLTETERFVLQFLTKEGAKTAPEVEQKIGKTREHAARLMKKLWQEGYIERDTQRIPFVYRITENLKKMEIKV